MDAGEIQLLYEYTNGNIVTPIAPDGLLINYTNYTEAGLCWNDNSLDEDRFMIYRNESGGVFELIKSVSACPGTGTVFYTNSGLTEDTLYSYYITDRKSVV